MSHSRTKLARPYQSSRRRGVLLMAMLVCLAIVVALAFEVTRTLLEARRQHRVRLDELQAASLADAGVGRALALLRTNREFAGETWSPVWTVGGDATADSLAVGDDAGRAQDSVRRGVIEIQVEPIAQQTERRRVIVTATYPPERPRSVVVRREFFVPSFTGAAP